MRNLLQLIASLVLLSAQAISPVAKLAAQTPASAAVGVTNLEVSINPKLADPIVVKAPAKPDFDTDVLAPLRAAQAAKAAADAQAAKAKAEAAAAEAAAVAAEAARQAALNARVQVVAATVPHVTAEVSPASMLALRMCEAGNIYTRNSGNGFYGAYQFDIGTWGGWGGYARADLAPAEVQDQKFLETFSRRGWAPWPACSRKLGFM